MTPWIEEVLKGKDHTVFLDNLGVQRKTPYTNDVVAATGGKCAFGPAWLTHGWGPIDRGHIGSTLKALAKRQWADWMEPQSEVTIGKSNRQLWETGEIPIRQKRILSIWICGEAWEELQGPAYKLLRSFA